MNREKVVEIKNLYKSFKDIHAVKGLDTHIYAGEFVGLLGPNGAGKTTLIEMIEGLQYPDSGEIFILGKPWKTNEHYLHTKIGLSLQETKFIDKLSVKETLILFASFYKLGIENVDRILKQVNLESKKQSYVVNLSGGQRQRLALGIALLNNPSILLLDEPTTGLDPSARRDIWDILDTLKKKGETSMILTTHYMEEAEYLCERILIMDQGTIIAEGSVNELTSKYGEGDIISFNLNKNAPDTLEIAIKSAKRILWDTERRTGKIVVGDLAQALVELVNFTQLNEISIIDIESRKMTLDDLFLQLTGRKLYE